MKKTNIRTILILTILLMLMAASNTFGAGLSVKKISLTVGESTQLHVSGEKKVSWKTSKKSVATVSKKGIVKAKKAGSCKITAKAGKKEFTCKVRVTRKAMTGSAAVSAKADAFEGKITSQVLSKMSAPERAVYQKMVAKMASLPEGTPWTNSKYYAWQGGIFSGGYGCAAFAFLLSDAAFGDAPAVMHHNVSAVRIGDVLRVDGNTHMVIVLAKTSTELIVAEGNYNSSIHWGRTISLKNLNREVDYVITRYA